MKKTIKITLGFLVIGFIMFYTADFLCQVEIKCKNCPKTSESVEFSKSNDFYIGEYSSETKTIELKNYNEKIALKSIWAEKSWIENKNNCLCPKLEKVKGYNIVIEFIKTKSDFIFTLTPLTNDEIGKNQFGISKNKKEMRFENLPDQLKILVEEKNPVKGIGWKKSIITDTIVLQFNKNNNEY